jgi:alanyl-tRNA synthetase
LRAISERLRGNRENVFEKTEQLLERIRQQEKEIQALKGKLASGTGGDLGSRAVEIGGARVLAARLDGADAGAMRDTVDQLRNKLGSAIVVLGAVEDGRVRLVAGVTKDLTGRVKAGELVNAVATQVGGKGGGRPDLAEAGGKDPDKLDTALASVENWVRQKLS